MNRDFRLEEQIRQFYDSVPNVDDALPLKDYLLKHADSRMAWYLLGKQYESQSRHAKAVYCFGQAGDIYEAFEAKPAPKLPDERLPTKPEGKRRATLIARWSLLLVVVGVAVVLFPDFAPSTPSEEQAAAESAKQTGTTAFILRTSTGQRDSAKSIVNGRRVISGISGPDQNGKEQLEQLLTGHHISEGTVFVRSVQLGKWTDWVKSGKPVAAVFPDHDIEGTHPLLWYDRKWCECKPGDSSSIRTNIQGWKPLQEQKLLLRSAMLRYRKRTGKWPDKPESLAGAYPSNTMAGWTDPMSAWFHELKGELQNKGKIPNTAGWPEISGPPIGNGKPAGLFSDMTEQPLSVIVDKSNHRLAIVSGSVLLRNYKVGLGGNKTPEGKFVITEKVRNPNGRSSGPFGSRGMTLSNSPYAIHGTEEPESVGKDESLGCIRMQQEDLEELYDLIPMGTTVSIVKRGLPLELRAPPERFRLPSVQDETNPKKVYNWLT